jgi:hypothetical protein
MAQTWPQSDPKVTQKWPKATPKWPQRDPKSTYKDPKVAQKWPDIPKGSRTTWVNTPTDAVVLEFVISTGVDIRGLFGVRENAPPR